MKHSDPFNQKIKQSLDEETLELSVQQELAQARQQALHSAQQEPTWQWQRPALALGLVAILAITVLLMMPAKQQSLPLDNIEAFDILTSTDELEMYQNLEFYLWLDQQPLEPLG